MFCARNEVNMSTKFNSMEYSRPDISNVKKLISKHASDFLHADSYEKYRDTYFSLQTLLREVKTQYTIAYIRNTMDTADKFYADEIAYFNNALPSMTTPQKKVLSAMLLSPFKESFEKEFGSLVIKTAESDLLLQDPKIVPQLIAEANLCTKYSLTAASCSTDFMGGKRNFYGLLKFMQSPDRDTRKNAYLAWASLYEGASSALDEIYTQLVRKRDLIAKKLGFDSYIKVAYLEKHRFDYNENDVASFREQVYKHITPLCGRLFKKQGERLGVDKLCIYDETIFFPDGNATPIGTSAEMMENARQMYHELSPESGEFFDFMCDNELFDLETRPGKHLGGYCTYLPKYASPFIFSNFNGTSADVDVLTHEAGHAFQHYTAWKVQAIDDNVSSTSEINEIHSMAMEFLTYPWMDKFFGEKSDKYRFAHLCSSLTVIPYIVCVDEFQHIMYQNPKMKPAERRLIWRDLEKHYMPWRDYDGNKFLENGGYWMQKQHIFLYPFYYIDYALAQLCAFELYGRSKENPKKAWEDYMSLCKAGGSLGYFDLLKLAGLQNPFENGSMEKMLRTVVEELEEYLDGSSI